MLFNNTADTKYRHTEKDQEIKRSTEETPLLFNVKKVYLSLEDNSFNYGKKFQL